MQISRGVRPRTVKSGAAKLGSRDPARQGFTLPLGTGRLERGAFVSLAYRLGQARATGALELFPPGGAAQVLTIRRGYVVNDDDDPLGRQAGRLLACLASVTDLRYRFRSRLACAMPGAIPGAPPSATPNATIDQAESYTGPRSCHLAVWARTHIEAQLDTAQARQMVDQLAGLHLALVHKNTPDPSLCDEVDRRILAAMNVPRRLHEIWPLSRTSRFRLLAFLHFLRCVGALRLLDRPSVPPEEPVAKGTLPPVPDLSNARRMLGVDMNADPETIRRAYHRRARALHPDLHPNASTSRRRLLERELATLTGAYAVATGRRRT